MKSNPNMVCVPGDAAVVVNAEYAKEVSELRRQSRGAAYVPSYMIDDVWYPAVCSLPTSACVLQTSAAGDAYQEFVGGAASNA